MDDINRSWIGNENIIQINKLYCAMILITYLRLQWGVFSVNFSCFFAIIVTKIHLLLRKLTCITFHTDAITKVTWVFLENNNKIG